ncbi:MAG: circularly permuted type 2 ATP-grasp protein [Myxococcales bacterium]|nr:circularly permuted type 2 ATP-grasp protein [Myxococcales bacterium]
MSQASFPPPASLGAAYAPLAGAYDELFEPDGRVREALRAPLGPLFGTTSAELARSQALAERSLLHQGVTFSVYNDSRGAEKIFPFCLVPRVVRSDDWAKVERGLEQRIMALQLFLDDVYGAQRFTDSPRLPAGVILGAKHYLPSLRGVRPPRGVRIHVAGIDLIRSPDGVFRVLEDNLRTPSGVSYVIENRLVTKRVLPAIFAAAHVRRVDLYPAKLAETLQRSAPDGVNEPLAVVLTPGPFNSAYFEHSFLARTMGIELVQGSDLYVDADRVFLKTTRGPRRVDVIYRRIDDAFLDPEVFRPDSLLGVPGIMRAWAHGNVTLANAPGNGVADDKAVCALVPDIIRFYLGEEPLLADVSTYVCAREDDRRYVLDHLDQLVVKAVDEAGGYGMLMGPDSTAAQREEFRVRIEASPRSYIAQPRVELSTCPTWEPSTATLVPRRVDLRPYILTSPDGPWVLPGGLTRVALREGSYVVNSSQGGGSKDTWVLAEAG